jgi:hypothetical protein
MKTVEFLFPELKDILVIILVLLLALYSNDLALLAQPRNVVRSSCTTHPGHCQSFQIDLEPLARLPNSWGRFPPRPLPVEGFGPIIQHLKPFPNSYTTYIF